ncbi:uncharacterized protein [Diadema setosum]|uniref:uncharacterized protein n=1 Tax=Diadema setosum TaxID=31175 RepID=UPI003B3B256F
MPSVMRRADSVTPGNRRESPVPGSPGSGTIQREPRRIHRQQGGRQGSSPLQQMETQNNGYRNVISSTITEQLQGRRPSHNISGRASRFPFYHAYLTEDEEENAFKDHLLKTGAYLMRDSKSNPHAVTMSVVIDPLHLYHFQVVESGRYFVVVGMGKRFQSLDDMLEYYRENSIPGLEKDRIYLRFPISCNRQSCRTERHSQPSPVSPLLQNGLSSPTSFNSPPRPSRRKSNPAVLTVPTQTDRTQPFQRTASSPSLPTNNLTPSYRQTLTPITEPQQNDSQQHECFAAAQEQEARPTRASSAVDLSSLSSSPPPPPPSSGAHAIDHRPPMPIPRPPPEPGRGHIYSEADDPDLDRIRTVLELCRQSDMMYTSRKKCTCGLYLEESTLASGWMMHIDNEPGKTQGRIFFLDTKTNRTTWMLPDDVEAELKSKFPVKWEFVEKQLASRKAKTNSP